MVIEGTERGAHICGIILTGKTILFAEDLLQCRLVHHKSYMNVMLSEAGECLSHAPLGN
jgi:hypothetical protein